MGIRCFRLAQKAASKVKKGDANVKYVHRPMSGAEGEEIWDVPATDHWTLHVDCAGFVRNTIQHVTKQRPFVQALSDRDFMRAKDFFIFFQSLPYTILDAVPAPSTSVSSGGDTITCSNNNNNNTDTSMMVDDNDRVKWRRIDDLRHVIAGDIICYRPRGHAAGGASFTENDRKDLVHVLQAVKTAQLWHEEVEQSSGNIHVTRNMAKHPDVKVWVKQFRATLHKLGIRTPKALRENLTTLNTQLQDELGEPPLSDFVHMLLTECLMARAVNTGHIVFVAGPPQRMETSNKDDDQQEYRFRVVHSTKFGYTDEQGNVTEGVQEYFRRFQLVRDPEKNDGSYMWTRHVSLTPEIKVAGLVRTDTCSTTSTTMSSTCDNNDDDPNSNNVEDTDEAADQSVEDDEGDEGEDDAEEGGEEAAGAPSSVPYYFPHRVDVIAARMCF
jgi:hypothetical protein